MSNLITTLDDRMNPIVVKELRQGLQSRFIIIVVNLLLVALTLACLIMVMVNPEITVEATGGREMFVTLEVMLLLASIVCVPIYVLTRLRSERNGLNVDLFFTTSLKPHKIIRGKFVAGMSLVTLLFSICLPFMLFTYVLRGYDIPSMLFAVGVGYLGSVVAMTLVIVQGTSPSYRSFSAISVLLTGFLLLILTYATCGMAFTMLNEGVFQSMFREPETLGYIGIAILAVLLFTKLFESIAVGQISPPSSNRSCRFRVWASISIVTLGVGLAGCAYLMNWVDWWSYLTAWSICSMGLVVMVFLIAMCEPDGFSNRIMLGRPRHLPVRLITFPYTYGASSGFLWTAIHTTLILGIMYVALEMTLSSTTGGGSFSLSSLFSDMFRWIVNGVCYTFLCLVFYALLAKLIMRWLNRFTRIHPKHTWAVFFLLIVFTMVSTMVVSYVLDPNYWYENPLWKLLNPIIGNSNIAEYEHRLHIVIAITAILLLLNLPQGLRDGKRYILERTSNV